MLLSKQKDYIKNHYVI